MKLKIICIANSKSDYLKDGIVEFRKRISRYVPTEWIEISSQNKWKKYNVNERIKIEEESIKKHIDKEDYVFLLDENGKEFNSLKFAALLQQKMNESIKVCAFVVVVVVVVVGGGGGGAHGFSHEFKNNANALLSLSKMIFSHQLIRLIFLEQLYRGFTILNNEPFHNE